ncbi:MAG: hypothetical protein OQK71_03480 [Desulfobacter sp.]|jgi:uncharacterized membrane protein YciS (DUF1049 family)|uniref:hypothetical protein n=1 Tax=uncultured Desulfobacter sp. TaxID=240139 RepID=UPI0029C9A08F|nr:hypothetical protein [uncultured Desulfobacter sp.]MCW8799970.1 hypothetical protein [Desulfobacter sp.]
MKIFKIILFIIFLVVLAVFGIQNQEYFLASTPLHIDFKISSLQYTVIDFPNWAYWVLCLVIGLLITGIRGLITAFRLKRQVRTRDERIESMKGEINSLQTRLDIFIHDPYIKKHLEEEARKDQNQEQVATEEKKKA